MKNKHAYQVPRVEVSTLPLSPVFQEAIDSNLIAAQLYSSIASSKAVDGDAGAAKADVEWQQLVGSAKEVGTEALTGVSGRGIRGTPEAEVEGRSSLPQSLLDPKVRSDNQFDLNEVQGAGRGPPLAQYGRKQTYGACVQTLSGVANHYFSFPNIRLWTPCSN